MKLQAFLRRLRVDGWCVLEEIIPPDQVPTLRQAVLDQETRERAEWEAVSTRMRAAGHRAGSKGAGRAQQIVSTIPGILPYLSHPRLIALAEVAFGPHVRISSVGGLISLPGCERGHWHADWPFNQSFSAHIPAPYPDVLLHLSTIFMLSPFSRQTGGTLILPGSHRSPDNPSGENGVDRMAPYPGEMNAAGAAGSVLVYDSRLWHAVAPNLSAEPRVALSVRYCPWWLNLEVRRQGSPDHTRIVVEINGRDNSVPLIPAAVYDAFPEDTKPLFQHWVDR